MTIPQGTSACDPPPASDEEEPEYSSANDRYAKRNKKRRFTPPEVQAYVQSILPTLPNGDITKLLKGFVRLLADYGLEGFDLDEDLDEEMVDVSGDTERQVSRRDEEQEIGKSPSSDQLASGVSQGQETNAQVRIH